MAAKKHSVPYDTFPEISKDFVGEVDFRMRSAIRAIEILDEYQTRKPRSWDDRQLHTSIRWMAARFAIMELTAVIDGQGELALKLHSDRFGKYSVQADRLKKLFPTLSAHELGKLRAKLNDLVSRNGRLLERVFHTRHHRIAHAARSTHKFDPVSLSSVRFPKRKFCALCNELILIMWDTAFGLEEIRLRRSKSVG